MLDPEQNITIDISRSIKNLNLDCELCDDVLSGLSYIGVRSLTNNEHFIFQVLTEVFRVAMSHACNSGQVVQQTTSSRFIILSFTFRCILYLR